MTSATYVPTLRRPRLSSTYGLRLLINTSCISKYKPHFQDEIDPDRPLRKSMLAPPEQGTFVKPIKQCFIKNPRLSPMTRIMLTLLTGWAGKGGPIETTTGIVGKHLSRCRRQVYRLLKDAEEEGYLYYTRTKDAIGRFTGIKIYLNFGAIRFKTFHRKGELPEKPAPRRGTLKSETNPKVLYNTNNDSELWEHLAKLAHTMGYLEDKKPPS